MAENTVATTEEHDTVVDQEETRAAEQYITPSVDIYETSEGLTLLADLPGVQKADLDVQVKENVLTIQAHAQQLSSGTPVYREFQLRSFFRQFQLSDRVNAEKISADFKNGVLTLKLPKAEETKPRQISVQVG